MRHHILAEALLSVRSWLAKSKVRRSGPLMTVTIVVILGLSAVGYYFLGALGALVGILLAVGMTDEIVERMATRKPAKRQVFCSYCGFQQDWAEGKSCEKCQTALRR